MSGFLASPLPPPPGMALAGAILLGYGASLWWLFRRETTTVRLGVLLVCLGALAVRLAYTGDFPAGLDEDEPKILACAYLDLMGGKLLGLGCTDMPVLLSALFQSQLIPVLGAGYWAIRLYSLVTSVLSVAAAFAVARSLRFSVVASYAVCVFIAVLPWSILYGRVSVGGELVFHQMLVLAALARLIWAERAGWPEIAIGALGLVLLCYDYFCGLAMLAMPWIAAVGARGRRLACLAIFVLAAAGFGLYLRANTDAFAVQIGRRVHPQAADRPIETIKAKAVRAMRSLREPIGVDQALTVRAGAIHPPLMLGLAVVGLLCAGRRAPFLLAGFAAGLAPAMVSVGEIVSSHRMMMSYAFIALAAGAAINVIPRPRWAAVLAIPIVAVIAAQSIHLYFSPAFWHPESSARFSADRTAVIDSLPHPPHPPFVIMRHLSYFWGPRAHVDKNYAIWSVENWIPADNAEAIYAFDIFAEPLRPFYEQLVGADRVRRFGRAFTVSFDARPWSWIQQHGWMYQARCGDTVREALVPTLYHEFLGFEPLRCTEPITHRWRGRWRGQPATLRLYVNGQATVHTPRGIVRTRNDDQARVEFPAYPGDEFLVEMTTPASLPPMVIRIMEVGPAAERVPLWESVDPLAHDPADLPAAEVQPPAAE